MNTAITLAMIWAVVGSACGFLPRRMHWPAAWVLIATGIPLLGYLSWKAGPLVGLIALLAGASILRWPVIRALGWMRRRVDRGRAS
jgi:hypothetical protein